MLAKITERDGGGYGGEQHPSREVLEFYPLIRKKSYHCLNRPFAVLKVVIRHA